MLLSLGLFVCGCDRRLWLLRAVRRSLCASCGIGGMHALFRYSVGRRVGLMSGCPHFRLQVERFDAMDDAPEAKNVFKLKYARSARRFLLAAPDFALPLPFFSGRLRLLRTFRR